MFSTSEGYADILVELIPIRSVLCGPALRTLICLKMYLSRSLNSTGKASRVSETLSAQHRPLRRPWRLPDDLMLNPFCSIRSSPIAPYHDTQGSTRFVV